MGLITLFILLPLSIYYFSTSPDKKPDATVNAVISKSKPYLAMVDDFFAKILFCDTATVCFWYGLIAAVLEFFTPLGRMGLLVRFVANILIATMSLPHAFETMATKYQEKLNPAILAELKNFVNWVAKNEKTFSYAGMASCVFLILAIFN